MDLRYFRIFAVLLSLGSSGAQAHTFWMEVSTPDSQGSRDVRFFVGEYLAEPEELAVPSVDRYGRFEAQVDEQKTADLRALFLRAQVPVARIPVSVSAPLLFVDSSRREIALSRKKFEAYLREERFEALLPRVAEIAGKRPVREEYYRCAKAILAPQQAEKSTDRRVTRAVGQELEIIPLVDPHAVPAGGEVRFRVLWRGAPLAHRSTTVASRIGAQVFRANVVTGEDGTFTVKRPRRGDWLIAVLQLEPSSNPEFDFRSVWASLWTRF